MRMIFLSLSLDPQKFLKLLLWCFNKFVYEGTKHFDVFSGFCFTVWIRAGGPPWLWYPDLDDVRRFEDGWFVQDQKPPNVQFNIDFKHFKTIYESMPTIQQKTIPSNAPGTIKTLGSCWYLLLWSLEPGSSKIPSGSRQIQRWGSWWGSASLQPTQQGCGACHANNVAIT